MSPSLNRGLEFHDSRLVRVSQVGTSAVLQFASAYVHESTGQPGIDPGVGWYQPATITVTQASIEAIPPADVTLYDGSLRAAAGDYRGIVPISPVVDGPVQLSLVHSHGPPCVVRGAQLLIELTGKLSTLESFRGGHRI